MTPQYFVDFQRFMSVFNTKSAVSNVVYLHEFEDFTDLVYAA